MPTRQPMLRSCPQAEPLRHQQPPRRPPPAPYRTWAFVALAAVAVTLPLQWQTLSSSGAGTLRYFHLAVIAVLGTVGFRRWATQTLASTQRTWLPLVVPFCVYSLAATAGGTLHGHLVVNYLQQGVYAAAGLAIAVIVADATRTGFVPRIAWWLGPLGVASFLLFFSVTLRSQGIDAVATFQRAITEANPDLINFALFKATFVAGADDSSANIRHEIFAALIALMWFSTWAGAIRRPTSRLVRALLLASALLTVGLVLISLSRAVALAMLLPALIPLSRFVLSGRARHPIRAALIGVACMLAVVPVWQLFSSRVVGETGSYSARGSSLGAAIDSVAAHPVLGAAPVEFSAHNFVLDGWLAGGLLAGASAVVFLIAFGRLWCRGWARYLRNGDPVVAAGLSAAALPLVRMFTAGGGLLHLSSFVALGVFLGVAMGGRFGDSTPPSSAGSSAFPTATGSS